MTFNAAFEEVVDCVRDTKMSAEEYFDSKTTYKYLKNLGKPFG